MSEFLRMCKEYGWEDSNPKMHEARKRALKKERKKAKQGIKEALTLQFNARCGTDVNDPSAWQNLCRVLQLSSVPEDLDSCREVSRMMHSLT